MILVMIGRIDKQFVEPHRPEVRKEIEKCVAGMEHVLDNQSALSSCLASTLRHTLLRTDLRTVVFDELIEVVRQSEGAIDWMTVWGKDDTVCFHSGCEYLMDKASDVCQIISLDNCNHGDVACPHVVSRWFERFWVWSTKA